MTVLSTAYDDREDLKMQVEDLDHAASPGEGLRLTKPLVASSATWRIWRAVRAARRRLWTWRHVAWMRKRRGSRRGTGRSQLPGADAHRRRVCWLAARRRGGAARAAHCVVVPQPVRFDYCQGDCAEWSLWADGGELSACTCACSCNMLFDDALNARLKRCFKNVRLHGARLAMFFGHQVDGLDDISDPTTVQCRPAMVMDTPKPIRPSSGARGERHLDCVRVLSARHPSCPRGGRTSSTARSIGLGIVLVGTLLGPF